MNTAFEFIGMLACTAAISWFISSALFKALAKETVSDLAEFEKRLDELERKSK